MARVVIKCTPNGPNLIVVDGDVFATRRASFTLLKEEVIILLPSLEAIFDYAGDL